MDSLDVRRDEPVLTTSTRVDGRRGHRLRILRLANAAVLIAVAAVAALVLQGFVQPFSVPGNAMAPTFKAGDRILVVKTSALTGSIRRGQIIVFRPRRDLPCAVAGSGGGDLVLRVVALPGETIWSVGDSIFVDGRMLHDGGWYDPRSGQIGVTPIVSTRLGAGQYYVLSDNRADACDSRDFGPISQSSIVGEGIAIVGRSGRVFFRTL